MTTFNGTYKEISPSSLSSLYINYRDVGDLFFYWQ